MYFGGKYYGSPVESAEESKPRETKQSARAAQEIAEAAYWEGKLGSESLSKQILRHLERVRGTK